jgi:hypothetical protein
VPSASRLMPRGGRVIRVAAQALACLAIIALPLEALPQALYKWIDKQGKVQYADKPPKNFTGPVTRIDVEPRSATQPTPAKEEVDAAVAEEKAPDIAAKRRALREALEADVESARAKLERAKAALAGAVPEDSERQVIQQRADKDNPRPGPGSSSTGGMLGSGGMYGNAAKSNCRMVTGSAGKSVVTCPTVVPGEAYYERIEKLEEAARNAAEELSAAEQAYRRGVD